MVKGPVDSRVQQIIRDQEVLAADRGNFESQWEEIAERVLPRSSRLFFRPGDKGPQGEKKTEKMLDATAAVALERYSAVVVSLTTPQGQKWHRLRASDDALNRKANVLRYFDEVTDIMFRYRLSPRSGFNGQQNEVAMSLGAFGTGLNYIDWEEPSPWNPTGGLRYRMTHLSESFLRENHQGVVDTVHRRFAMDIRKIKQLADAGVFTSVPETMLRFASTEPDKKFDLIHCVAPNDDYVAGRRDWRGMSFVERYVCVQEQAVLCERGYRTFPYAVGRSTVSPGETYGRSPGMTVLPNVKVLNEQKKTHLKMGHRLADPILLAHDDGILDNFSARPGSITAGGISSAGQKLVQRLDENVGQLGQLAEMMTEERRIINDAFLVTLFQILVETPTMTATEVLERTREKSMLLAPTMGRFQSEYLGPMIEREIDLLSAAGVLPEMPAELIEAQGDYSVVYESPLAKAMRAEEAAGFNRWAESGLNIAQVTQDPSILDWIEGDIAYPELADIHAVPARWVSTPERVAEKRAGRQQQANVQTAIDAGPSIAAMVKANNSGPARAGQ